MNVVFSMDNFLLLFLSAEIQLTSITTQGKNICNATQRKAEQSKAKAKQRNATQEVDNNFRTDFPENDRSIWLSTQIFS